MLIEQFNVDGWCVVCLRHSGLFFRVRNFEVIVR
jgi:hypothetical protein